MEEEKLKRAKQVALIYNVIGFVASILLLFYGTLRAEIIMGLIYPLLAIPVIRYSSGLIKFSSDSKKNPPPNILIGFMGSLIFMFIISFDAYQIFQYNNLWILMIVVVILVTVLIYMLGVDYSVGVTKGQLFVILFVCAMYGYSGVVTANCAFDNTTPIIYNATVINHRVETGKHTSYLLTLSEWGPMNKQKEEDVGKSLFYRVNIGDTVHVHFKKGLFNAPWYQVKLN